MSNFRIDLTDNARVFDEHNINWHPSLEFNTTFLRAQAQYFDHVLMARGHVFLNDVYDALGFKRTPAGQLVGWLFESERKTIIEIGLDEDGTIKLDFPVDGVVIYDKI